METEAFKNFWQIYYYIALFATILFIIKMSVFMLFGGDTEVSADFNTETDTDTSFSFLSFQSVLAFFMGFGWMGYAALKQFNLPQLTALLSALAVGLLFMAGSAWLMLWARKLEKTVKKDKNTAIGKIGKAYTNFDENGNGKVEIEIAGQLTIVDAQNAVDMPIKSFDRIKVIGVKGDILQVIKDTEE